MLGKSFLFGIVVFPGSNCDQDCFYVIEGILEQKAVFLWHSKDFFSQVDVIVIPGGFSYGDYLRSGAIASHAPIMRAIFEFSERGGLVLGICNGFQILLEASLLEGALHKNDSQRFICKAVDLQVLNTDTPFTNQYVEKEIIRIPIAHGEGAYRPILEREGNAQKNALFSYHEDNPNGSFKNIAGLSNEGKNVLGMMPHPERCSEKYPLGDDGLKIFKSIVHYLKNS